MRFDGTPYGGSFLSRLSEDLKSARDDLSEFRRQRFDAIVEYVGPRYGDRPAGTPARQPINDVAEFVNTYRSYLFGDTPQAMTTTRNRKYKRDAERLGMGLDRLGVEIDLRRTLEMGGIDAFFLVGIVKTGVHVQTTQEIFGYLHDITQPHADHIQLDDWVHDMEAYSFETCRFMGHRYEVDLDWAKKWDGFDEDGRKLLQPKSRARVNEDGDERASTIGMGTKGTAGDEPEFRTKTELWDIWLPLENMVLTIPAEESEMSAFASPKENPLRIVDYRGHETGPYHILGFSDVPGRTMPIGPIQHLIDLVQFNNQITRKLMRQGERQKTHPFYRDAKMGQKLQQSFDGKPIEGDPDAIEEKRFGGPDQVNVALSMMMRDLFDRAAGNLSLLAGLGPQSDTATQDQLLAGSASNRLKDMQGRVLRWTEGIYRSLAWHLMDDPFIDMPLTKRVGNTEIPIRFRPMDMESDILDHEIKINPHSMKRKTPEVELQTMRMVMQEFIMPFGATLEQRGSTLNVDWLLKRVGELTGFDDMNQLLISAQPMEQAAQTGQQKPPNTSRTYNRTNSSTATPQGQSQAIQQVLQGIGNRQGEAA